MRRLVVTLVIAAALTTGCSKSPPPPTTAKGIGGLIEPPNRPDEYFPTSVGSRWTYDITVLTAPVSYRQVSWPIGGGRSVSYLTRGFIRGAMPGDAAKGSFTLTIGVKSVAAAQGPLRYRRGVELAVEEDTLGVFENGKQLFLAIPEGRFTANLVATFDSRSAPGGSTAGFAGVGSAMRVVYFDADPMTAINVGKGSADTLLYTGLAANPDQPADECRHFRRVVQPAERRDHSDPVRFELGFNEESWFARGKGLVRLEQRVAEEISMIWRLRSFTPGDAGVRGGNLP
jgi:hypothetical protein